MTFARFTSEAVSLRVAARPSAVGVSIPSGVITVKRQT